jgi:diguanylate cyclase (GGDEF)-like protein
MKTVRDVMTADVVWVSPSARVKTAVILMRQNKIAALPVVDNSGHAIGLVTQDRILGESEDTTIANIMQRDFAIISPNASVREASEEMVRSAASHLLVIEDDQLVGIVSRSDLLPELGKNFDPLTGLPWSNALREWAMNALKRGNEIAVIFFDLDDYGKFNKKYGHVVGDSVIRAVAEAIKKGIDPDRELACRYAGDEFAIVSLRQADDARALAEEIKLAISRLQIEGIPGGVTATYGISGGRRQSEREDIHYAATVDDLITRASKDCEAHKPRRAAEASVTTVPEHPAPTHPPSSPLPSNQAIGRLKIRAVTVSTTDTEVTASVTLSRGDNAYTREARGQASGAKGMLRLVAEATAGAASDSMESDYTIVADEVVFQTIGEDDVVTVTVTFITPRWSARQAGSVVVRRGDAMRAAAAAVLAATNRLIESALST